MPEPLVACSHCGGGGHTRRTCPERVCDECGAVATRLYRLVVDGQEGRYCVSCRWWYRTHGPMAPDAAQAVVKGV